jgi:hypothetical protein
LISIINAQNENEKRNFALLAVLRTGAELGIMQWCP